MKRAGNRQGRLKVLSGREYFVSRLLHFITRIAFSIIEEDFNCHKSSGNLYIDNGILILNIRFKKFKNIKTCTQGLKHKYNT